MSKTITLAHGNGGAENNELISKVFYKAFKNDILVKSEDAAVIHNGELAFSTDSFTVSPLFFNGADIGKLAICGTCNDLSMMGAKPKYLTCSVIIEEGFEIRSLEKIVRSMKEELAKNGAIVVSGDTKVVPKGSVDKIFINTTGIGEIQYKGISSNNITEDDLILVSRDIGAHGATIFAAREGMDLETSLKSDCTSLYPQVEALINAGIKITALRDATRGGVSAVLNEWAKQSNICIEVEEDKIPICDEVKGICEMLGFEAMSLANEGTFVLAIPKEDAQKAIEVLHTFEEAQNASVIGKVTQQYEQKVILYSPWGTKRFLDTPTGELLPRIC
ncbi:hydrogenase expression/formation protein HypE [Poseidonibacter ostreae]|jgi:hydrogenase expression/formation protein HypE|uniref:Hydrogenase expression/formation protein HypE n=1 Tax=Poseidonibacter ostreae TaxID=2654171 RepID=A0A6L4WRN7_9BACT|nr:hydrogenase expression/formation protein HypE [Poseidonibacter ostreae]KAB7883011.1 hydrogenase expression/formation protein HypE [Poseidonibacter ostreae]KAB7888079.1 hydrogenase expression/formation protein HypE [Poseidonibacter ostreae]KAB7891694.1 hydrogenase expression/formation protein HypE [Poseidonibacter ostreae]MAC82557.1 hydrogenase expression/formation protein HypE [Arcobacter sp.]|tara:strand:+ start:8405 stop:9403 length:999 start_codon:yes stop_codon:yes gene_type:complete